MRGSGVSCREKTSPFRTEFEFNISSLPSYSSLRLSLTFSCSELEMSESAANALRDHLPTITSSNQPPHQSRVVIQDLEAELAAGTSSNVARQAALLPPINISDHGHTTRARSTRARPLTDSPTTLSTGDVPPIPATTAPPTKKRKTIAATTNAAGGPSKPPKRTAKGKEKAPAPPPQQPASPTLSSPIQKLASAIRERLPGLFPRDSDPARRRAASDPPNDNASALPHTPPSIPSAPPPAPLTTTRPQPSVHASAPDDPTLTIKQSALEELIAKIVREQRKTEGTRIDGITHRTPARAMDLSDDEDAPIDFRIPGSTPSSAGKYPRPHPHHLQLQRATLRLLYNF